LLRKARNNNLLAIALAAVVVLCWSTVATAFKLGLSHLSVAQLLFLSCLFSFIFFVIVSFFIGFPQFSTKTILRGASLGILNPLLYYFILFAAYERLPAQIAQPLNCTHAIVTALIAIPILNQRPKARVWLGMCIGYLGVVVLVTQGTFQHFDFDNIGVVLALGSSVIWATYWTLNVRFANDPISILFIGFCVATPLTGLYCLLFDQLPEINMTNLGFGLWVGICEMGLAFLLWQRALKIASHVGLIAPLAYLSPALSLIFIQYVLGENVHLMTIAGLAVLLCGIFIVHFQRFKRVTENSVT